MCMIDKDKKKYKENIIYWNFVCKYVKIMVYVVIFLCLWFLVEIIKFFVCEI